MMPHHSDIFAKADALMKKHRTSAIQPLPPDAIPAAPAPQPADALRPEAGIPVLTDIVVEALPPEPEPIPVLTEMVADELPEEPVSAMHEPPPVPEAMPYPEQPGQQEITLSEPAEQPSAEETGRLAEPPWQELEDRIREGLARQLAPQLAAALEKSLAGALDQFAVQIEHLVRDAVTSEVRRQLDALQSDSGASARKTAD
ncbi:MAG: hypothetical protein AB1710_08540 [Pseudomonadota bacterium]